VAVNLAMVQAALTVSAMPSAEKSDVLALVAVIFDSFDFAHAHTDVLAEALADFCLGGAGALLTRVAQHILRDLSEVGVGMRELAGHELLFSVGIVIS
jgi:hypothetical protein